MRHSNRYDGTAWWAVGEAFRGRRRRLRRRHRRGRRILRLGRGRRVCRRLRGMWLLRRWRIFPRLKLTF
ncbi:MAG: hypothetical protein D6697_09550 [Armatimonadetes bacterium]|nr:MAG: hypothetical protein D6697_09550 [Armatimonadota bacterium]